jgi:hypothetical protein
MRFLLTSLVLCSSAALADDLVYHGDQPVQTAMGAVTVHHRITATKLRHVTETTRSAEFTDEMDFTGAPMPAMSITFHYSIDCKNKTTTVLSTDSKMKDPAVNAEFLKSGGEAHHDVKNPTAKPATGEFEAAYLKYACSQK